MFLRADLSLTLLALLLQAGLEAVPVEESGPGTLRIFLVGLLIVAPIYLFLAFFVRIVREAYGFIEIPKDSGPPLRVCYQCDNTVLEPAYVHCPYCGNDLPPVESMVELEEDRVEESGEAT
jgi:hypothetical protein